MQNRYRLIFAAIALAAFALAFAAVGASGTSDAEDPPKTGPCGDGVYYTFDKGTLHIMFNGTGTVTGMMDNYKSNPGVEGPPPWEEYEAKITTLKIDEGVTSIGNYAFEGCVNIEGKLAIPDTITYIGTNAFQFCAGLKGELIIPDKVTYIGSHAFEGCKKLTGDLKIPNSVKILRDCAFQGCSGFNGKLTLPDNAEFDTIGDYAFEGCEKLTGDLVIPNTVGVIGNSAFLGCTGLTGLTFSNGSKLKTIGGYAFNGCSGLTGTLTIPATVENIDYGSFGRCSRLTGFAVEDGNLSYVSDQGILYNMGKTILLQCPGGKDGGIAIPGTVETIGNGAFQGCSKLTGTLTIGEKVTYIGDRAFSGCEFTGTLTIPGSVTSIGKYAFNGCKFTGTLTIGEKVTYIGDGAFMECKFTGDLVIPSSVMTIGERAFSGCEFTGTLTIPGSVTSIGKYAFAQNTFYDYDDKWVEVDATAENLRGKAWMGKADENYVKLYRSFEITFDANGGSFQTGDGEKTLYADPDRKLSEDPGAPSKTGHDFTGWFTASDEEFDQGNQFAADTTYLARYAKWNLTVTFHPGEGTGKMDDQIIYYDSEDMKLSQCVYSKEDFIFVGWQDKTGQTYDDCHDMSYYEFSSADDKLVLTAQWEVKTEYDVIDGITGGSLHEKPEKAIGKQPLELTIRPDVDRYVEIETIEVYVGDRGLEYGKDFDHQLKQIVISGENVNVMVVSIYKGVIDGNVTVTAECPKDRIGIDVHLIDEGIKGFTYTVDGVTSDLFTTSKPFDVEIGSDVILEVVLKEGFLFVKWDDDHRSGKATFENVREYIELYPVTKPENEVYEITFDANGGTPAETKVKTDKYGKLASIPKVTRDGYTFVKWEEVETGNEVTASYIFEWDTIVEAVWEMDSPNPDPNPTPKPKPPVITVNINFKSTTGGKISMDSAKIPLNAKVTVNGDTLIIGSGSSKTIVKAEPFNGFVFDSWSIEDGNILTDGEVTAKFRAITLSGISVESSPAKTEYREGEKFDPTGLVIIAGFDNMSSMTMGYDGNKGLFTFSPSLDAPLSSEDTKVTVYYNGQSTDVAITVTSDSGDDTVMYVAIGVAVAVALAAVAAFFLIRKP